jgi:integrase
MRADELRAIKWTDVKKDHVVLHKSKTDPGRGCAFVPGGTILEQLRGWDAEYVFGFSSQSLDANFRKYRERAGLEGFTFRDTRHTVATRIVVRPSMTTLVLGKIFGWTNPKQAMTYFNPTASQLATMP